MFASVITMVVGALESLLLRWRRAGAQS
jgi:hypothetical protein